MPSNIRKTLVWALLIRNTVLRYIVYDDFLKERLRNNSYIILYHILYFAIYIYVYIYTYSVY